MELTDFYAKFIELTDRVLPAIHNPSDQLVYLQFFSRTIAIGEKTCRISYKDLGDLTGLSTLTLKTAIRRLVDLGALRIVGEASAKIAKTYEVHWLSEVKRTSRLERSPMVALKESGGAGEAYNGILDKLTDTDKEMLDILISSLTLEEERNLRQVARTTVKDGDSSEQKFREVVVLSKFGPERLKKYAG